VGLDTGSPVGPYPHLFPCTENTTSPWTPLVKPIEESKVVLISSGGLPKGPTPFNPQE
jgi:hypothetical protein